MKRIVSFVVASAAVFGCCASMAQSRVEVPSFDTRGSSSAASGSPVAQPGYWFAADVPAGTRAPAVVLLHGCGGLQRAGGKGGMGDEERGLGSRMTEYARFFNRIGVHALVTDSLTPRGQKELCTQKHGERTITQRERRSDALGALRWLAQRPEVDPQRLGLVGWSHGGSAVMAATDITHEQTRAESVRPSLAVAFYPGCGASLREGYAPSAPLLMLVGEADDWTPAWPCVDLAAKHKADKTDKVGAGKPGIDLVTYPGAYHGFDSNQPVRLRTDVPNGTRPGKGVHVGGDPDARVDARIRLERFVRERWQLR